jgi:Flp pilus assembly protein TadD
LLYFLLGRLYVEAQDYPKSIEALAKASSLATQPADKAVIERDLGMAYYHTGDFPNAEKAYLASLGANGNDPVTLNNLAYMYVNDLDQADKALPYATRAAQLMPNNPDILDTYGWALARSGAYEPAERQLTRAFQLSRLPTSVATIHYHLGWICEQTRRSEEAARHYRQGLESLHDPNNPLTKDIAKALERVQPK